VTKRKQQAVATKTATINQQSQKTSQSTGVTKDSTATGAN